MTGATARARHELAGVPASSGVARGRWLRIQRIAPATRSRQAPTTDAEIDRLKGAAAAAASASTALAQQVRGSGHAAESEIFAAHAAIADDPELLEDAAARIRRDGASAEEAILAAARAVAEQLTALRDELLRGRAEDVVDVADSIARRLSGAEAPTLTEPVIVCADDLPPSVTATLPRDKLLGIALERSSPTSHAAILARAYGIPSVVGASGLLAATEAAGPETLVMIDGTTGRIVIDPDDDDAADFATRASAERRSRAQDEADAGLPCLTKDGVRVTLLANIGGPGESATALRLGAEGVGLYRTEFLFLERQSPPSEDEQVEAYADVVAAFAPRPVTIRLLDVGGDKPIPYLRVADEANPFLGVRALRLAKDRPDLFLTQLRACYRAAVGGAVKIMAPMVADADDVGVLLDLAERARRDLAARGQACGDAGLGVMIEIPSAALVAETYLSEIGFASLGTNDLLQYTLAADRGNAQLTRYRDPLHPALLRLIKTAADASARAGVPLSVCGEMAADPVAALALVGIGLRSLSMVAGGLPTVKRAIRGVTATALAESAAAALHDRTAEDARARFEQLRS